MSSNSLLPNISANRAIFNRAQINNLKVNNLLDATPYDSLRLIQENKTYLQEEGQVQN